MQFIKRKIVFLNLPYVVSGVLYEFIRSFLFYGRSSMIGAAWFLTVLFVVEYAVCV